MRTIGIYMLIFGLGSAVMSFFDLNFRLLMWIDAWGPGAGWAIRLGLIIAGAALFLTAKRPEPQAAPEGE